MVLTFDLEADDYSMNTSKNAAFRVLLVNRVVVGKPYKRLLNATDLTEPPSGYHSVWLYIYCILPVFNVFLCRFSGNQAPTWTTKRQSFIPTTPSGLLTSWFTGSLHASHYLKDYSRLRWLHEQQSHFDPIILYILLYLHDLWYPVHTSLTIHNQIYWQYSVRVVDENRFPIIGLGQI